MVGAGIIYYVYVIYYPWLERTPPPYVQLRMRMDDNFELTPLVYGCNAGPDGAIFAGCCNFTEAKICEACTVLLDKGLSHKNRTTLAEKRSVWP